VSEASAIGTGRRRLRQLYRGVRRRLGLGNVPEVELPPGACRYRDPALPEFKLRKRDRIRGVLRPDAGIEHDDVIDCLPDALRERYRIVETDNAVPAYDYDPIALDLIARHPNGLLLDCGSGLRQVYRPQVVNFEVVRNATTDVLGVGEELPFKDNSFDAAFSLAVLEHVKDPFACARELARVLKPGGTLYCVVPFLQPFHAFPHHYYNMSHEGLANLFEGRLDIERQEVLGSGHPIFTITWILRSWAQGLTGEAKQRFLQQKVEDLILDPDDYFNESWVTSLPAAKCFELASTTALIARKPLPA
jgi:SAM-dependent methyltransferase